MLWEDLENINCVSELRTYRLNQDCLENFFSVIRGRGGHRDNPDTLQFISAYRNVSVDLLFHKSHQSNCSEDMDQFALKLEHLTVQSKEKLVKSTTLSEPNLVDKDPDRDDLFNVSLQPPSLSLVENNIIMYLSGYVVKKALHKYPCNDCAVVMKSSPETIPSSVFIQKKLYDDDCNLTYPTQPVVSFISNLEKHFRSCTSMFHSNNLMKTFVNRAPPAHCPITCPKHADTTYSYMVRLYFIVRIHHHLKQENEEIRSQSKRKNRKLMKLCHL